ncbi:hypothetical protein B9479_003094 [Cryptococcus floricola]|uniref:Uncharacterized protein n=1 Tax=Cryptococcus floricola TaxID=2591691 RepID=A0A5D3B1D3_9TREE|nr:hypothetical protein B9479_003094 [Cryptococcus floricola]
MDTSKHPVEEIELPVYYTPSAPEALELTSITALAPVHHIIIDHLALVAPVTTLLLSTYVYDITIPKLYRHVTASKSLLRGLESAEPGNRRKLDCLRHTETLKVENMAAMWHVSMLDHHAAAVRYAKVFPNCTRVEISQDVVDGHYHMKKGEIVEDWSFSTLKETLSKQMKEGCEIVEIPSLREGKAEGDDAMSMTFPSGSPFTLNTSQPAPDPLVAEMWGFVGMVLIWAPVILFILLSCAGYNIPSLNITNATANITSDDGSTWAMAKISIGPSGGCMYYDDSPRKCIRTLDFKPDPAFLHLPANQTLTTSLSQTLNRAFITNYISAGWIGVATISLLVGFSDNSWSATSQDLMIWGSLFAWLSFWLNVAICLNFRRLLNAHDKASGWDYHVGNGLWLFLYTVVHTSFLANIVNSKTTTTP